jgi:FkbM family methyltransferase
MREVRSGRIHPGGGEASVLEARPAPAGRRIAGISQRRRAKVDRLRRWGRQVACYWGDSQTPSDFKKVMRVRLSQSKVGRWVTPDPIVVDVDLRSMGRSVRLRSHTTDISVLAEITLSGALNHLPERVEPETVVDLGANTGLAYRWLRERYPAARFVCVEPDPGNLEVLRANADAVGGPVRIVGACIGAHARRARLSHTGGEWGFRMMDVVDEADADTDVVTMTTILAEAGIARVGLLKCDIEGAEAELFADCRAWIDRVDNMIVECHTDVTSVEALLHTLKRNGGSFALRHLDSNPQLGFEIATLERTADLVRD